MDRLRLYLLPIFFLATYNTRGDKGDFYKMEEKEKSSDYLIFHNKMEGVTSKESADTILAPGYQEYY